MDIDYSGLPEHIRGQVRRYIEEDKLPGGFVEAVLRNDLRGAFTRADYECGEKLTQIVSWFHNEAPDQCWGSDEKVERWLSREPRHLSLLRRREHLYAIADDKDHLILRSFGRYGECEDALKEMRRQTGNPNLKWYNVSHPKCPEWLRAQLHVPGDEPPTVGKPNGRPDIYAIVDEGKYEILEQHRDFKQCITNVKALRAKTGNQNIVWYDTSRTSCPDWVNRALFCGPEQEAGHGQDLL